jgi:flagellar basal body P-ring protein FlgI
MMTARDAPRYIVAQKMPTPISSMIVAKSVANGILVMHDLQQPKNYTLN